jgi:AAA ATPase-like protein/putative AbiEii toxin of type IV toxin-antitoxin system/uncharacterized protein DUF3696
MILKALTLENFKGIRDPVRVELAPVTLLFGPNNAGKSTIVQALIYAREVFERNNTDAGRTQLGGDIIDLGGFENLVYGHDLSRVIRMRFELDLSKIGLPDYTDPIREVEFESCVHNGSITTRKTEDVANALVQAHLWVEIEIAWSHSLNHSLARTYRVGTGSTTYATLECLDDGQQTFLSYFNAGFEPFGKRFLIDILDIASDLVTDEESSAGQNIARSAGAQRKVVYKTTGWLREVFDSLIEPDYIPCPKIEVEVEPDNIPYPCEDYQDPGGKTPLAMRGTALPEWSRRIKVDPRAWNDYDIPERNVHWEFPFFAHEYFRDLLTTVIVGPGERLLEALKQSIYLSPFREMTPRHYHPAHSPESRRWANGLAAWDWLMLGGPLLVKQVNAWLEGKDKLNTGYRIEVTQYRELDTNSPLMTALTAQEVPSDPTWHWIRQTLNKLQDRLRLQIRNLRSDIILFPQDLGVGISQVVPVLVAALHNTSGIVAIEEPESNIHPAFQVVLADLFITQARANPGVMFLVETHSEHLMLRFLRRIRETSKSTKRLESVPSLTPKGIAVHFVEPTQDGPRIHRIAIDEEGDFMDEWPGGFFEESFHEKFSGR